MTTYYPQYESPSLTYPVTVNDWSTALSPVQMQYPVYNLSVHVPPFLTPICPYSGAPMTQPLLAPVVQPLVIEEVPASYVYDNVDVTYEQTVPSETYQALEEIENVNTEATLYETVEYDHIDPLEIYLSLPKDLFPTARMLALDPNPIIDEFCKIVNIYNHAPWILDLEFGVPRVPITRSIATYDVKFNSVHCKNTPNAIHPGFESCSQEFKNVLLFYYDCVISLWYKGYVLMNCDGSVENFQSWMSLPLQLFGMCWP